MKDGNGYKELSLSDAKTAVKAKKAVKVYTLSHKEGYGSVWNSNYTYTDYRTSIQIGENSGINIHIKELQPGCCKQSRRNTG